MKKIIIVERSHKDYQITLDTIKDMRVASNWVHDADRWIDGYVHETSSGELHTYIVNRTRWQNETEDIEQISIEQFLSKFEWDSDTIKTPEAQAMFKRIQLPEL